jgi:hypothetical protein
MPPSRTTTVADKPDVRERAARLLKEHPNNLPVFPDQRDPGVLGASAENVFSVFVAGHEERAVSLAEEFMSIVSEKPGDEGLAAVLDAAEEARTQQNSELVKHALMLFITHDARGRSLPIPPLAERSPAKAVPSRPVEEGPGLLPALGKEAQLDYFREDTAVNDHHLKWHIVYPGPGQPDPINRNPRAAKDRQGELFWYMHQQMLARYDTERTAFGLPLTQPLENYRAAIEEGYDSEVDGLVDRAANLRLRDLDGYTVAQHEIFRDRLLDAARQGVLQRPDGSTVPITPSLLGAALEPSHSINRNFYGFHHNWGHGLISAVDQRGIGVMSDPQTAVRDPVFFRWHRHVDDIFVEWQDRQPPQDLAAGAPPVRLRKGFDASGTRHASPDILLVSERILPQLRDPAFDGQSFGETSFGGQNWDSPLSSLAGLSDELHTKLGIETIENGAPVPKHHLDHDEFCYFIRLENQSDQARRVTLRIFLAAVALAANRRMWIEMDKFTWDLTARQRSVVYRPARLSAVVRKPARRPMDRPTSSGSSGDDYCDCGWPYHLLLPRGNEAGMDFRLLVLLTDFEADLATGSSRCGSLSFCGRRDGRYPDRRAMGYPFDRPFSTPIEEVIAGLDHMATRDFKIRFLGSTA